MGYQTRKAKTGLRLLELQNSKVFKYRIEYGESMGYESFGSFEEMQARTLPWIASEIKRLSKRLDDLSALQNEILGC